MNNKITFNKNISFSNEQLFKICEIFYPFSNQITCISFKIEFVYHNDNIFNIVCIPKCIIHSFGTITLFEEKYVTFMSYIRYIDPDFDTKVETICRKYIEERPHLKLTACFS